MDSILVTEEENNSRLDRVIKRVLGNINQASLEKFLRQKLILVENKKAKSSQRVKKNQVISYSNSIIFNNQKPTAPAKNILRDSPSSHFLTGFLRNQ